jgi:hypothetical protein
MVDATITTTHPIAKLRRLRTPVTTETTSIVSAMTIPTATASDPVFLIVVCDMSITRSTGIAALSPQLFRYEDYREQQQRQTCSSPIEQPTRGLFVIALPIRVASGSFTFISSLWLKAPLYR